MARVNKKMLIESDPHQTRIAILENDQLTETFVARHQQRGLVGNIYKGRVTRVLPGMQAAFVDIGLERDAFLYVDDVGQLDDDQDGDVVLNGLAGIGEERPGPAPSDSPSRAIDELIVDGQELVVQVSKDALPNKGARVTMHVTLPSRYLVLLPTVRHFGVSRRIEDEAERSRLRAEIDGLVSGAGLIVRTAGEGRGRDDFSVDLGYLNEVWQRVRGAAERTSPPALLHRELDLALRVVRDLFGNDYSVLWVDQEEVYERVVSFLDQVQPALVGRVKLDRHGALFERFDVERELEAALQSKVWLRSGGYLVINQTEALVAIDVNTGRYIGHENLEETALKTNLEAVREMVRQIRLRDLSGILILDLIDMAEQQNRDRVFAALEEELRRDRAKNKVLNISEFGLVEVTRKRSHANLERLLTRPCPYCSGRGRIKTSSTICLNLRREVLRQLRKSASRELLLRVHPEVAEALQTEERAILDELQHTTGASILLQSDADLHRERFDILEL